jgi:ribonucleoside-diphosphate reductase alpha chain
MERRKLPRDCQAITHRFKIGEEKSYITVGLYEDGTPGEVFIRSSKKGSITSGMLDSFAIMVSLALQYGIPLDDLVRKFKGVHFEPFGVTSNKEIPIAQSIIDYIFRWLELRFVKFVKQDGN